MSPSRHRLVLIALALSIPAAFLAGRWSAGEAPPEKDIAARPAVQSSPSDPASRDSRGSAPPGAASDNKNLPPFRQRLTVALKEKNRLQRLKKVLGWTDTINETNWREAYALWMRSGTSSKFVRDVEARVVLEKIGAAGGAAAMEVMADSSQNVNTVGWRSRYVMAGWASAHPLEARDWIAAMQDLPGQPWAMRGEARGGLMEGLFQSDLDLARQFAVQVKSEWRDEHIRGIIENMERDDNGAAGVTEWIEKSRQEGGDPEFTAQLTSSYVQRELDCVLAGSENTAIYDWVATQCTAPAFSPQLIGIAAATMARKQPAQAIDWLAKLPPQAMTPDTTAQSVARVAAEWQIDDPSGLTAWLSSHPQHPLNAALKQATLQSAGEPPPPR